MDDDIPVIDMRSTVVAVAVAMALAACGGGGTTDPLSSPAPVGQNQWPDSIRVGHPVTLPASLQADRIPVGEPGDYKPDIVLLASGELLLTLFSTSSTSPIETIYFYRSSDGGKTWGERENPGLIGREPYLTIFTDGTLFLTTQVLATNPVNTEGHAYAYVYRSADGGHTWDATLIDAPQVPGTPPNTNVRTSRNIVQLADGSLILGVSAGSTINYTWRSYNDGLTWDTTTVPQINGYTPDEVWRGWYGELWFYVAPNGDLLGIARVDDTAAPIPNTTLPPSNDYTDRLILFRSHDGGATWDRDPDIGSTYGEEYPSLLHLADGRVLFTFTVRSLQPQLGVQAVLGTETSDGFTLNFAQDQIVVDNQTPAGQPSGGGFGNTLQLADGTLVTAYSYRDAQGATNAEVVRWRL